MKRTLLTLAVLVAVFTAGLAARQYAPWSLWNDVVLDQPLPCGTVHNLHSASMSHPNMNVAIILYVCYDGRTVVREFSFLSNQGPGPVTPSTPVDPRVRR